MGLLEELKEITGTYLGDVTAGTLKDFIEQAKKDKETLVTVTSEVEDLKTTLDTRNKELVELRSKVSLQEVLDEQETSLLLRKQTFDKEILTIKLVEADKQIALMDKLVSKVFGHPSVSIATATEVITPVDGGGNCPGFTAKDQITEQTTTTKGKR